MNKDSLASLDELIRTLRAPGGCPWDREQKFEDVLSDLIEESYELAWAGTHHGDRDILDEMGDVLFLVCFAVAIRREADPAFTLEAIAEHAYQKIYSRHPHVFGDLEAKTALESIGHWENMKAEERRQRDDQRTTLGGIPGNMPPLRHAEKVQERAASVGFDWNDASQIVAKLREEIDELEEAIDGGRRDAIQHELGDVLFSVVNVSRFLKFDTEGALKLTTSRFIRRFETMEGMIHKDGRELSSMNLEEMDEYWNRVKAAE